MEKNRNGTKYDDIIDLPHHVSKTRPRMSAYDRAAQFSPFMALTGYEEAVEETARLTDAAIELTEESRLIIGERLQRLGESEEETGEIRITHFVPDERKAGGAYVTVTGTVASVDAYSGRITMSDRTVIPFDCIIDIDGEFFSPREEH